ncbi:unnamed protein product [Miscanthus lutarioriparius]|uniref:Protein kinase domain-containing protein n=1 Tax=Miscanthus lutarioriparius TaxID=422564 RepID=A0A811QA22_9POAL|nr:unnamed protein product [Miscanthus lutarioriparius]
MAAGSSPARAARQRPSPPPPPRAAPSLPSEPLRLSPRPPLSLPQAIVVGRKGSELLTNDAGEITRQEILLALPVACGFVEPDSKNVRSRDKARVSFLHSCGPCQLFAVSLLLLTVLSFYARFVFDGEPPGMKKKELAKRSLKRDDATQDLNRAMEVTRKHNDDCKRLLRLMGVPVVEIEDRFYIYLEYVHPGSINKYVKQHYGAMTESVIRNFTRHILMRLAFLHGQKIMHRDIKGANLLVDVQGVVKLADFGMAKHLSTAAPNLSLKGTPYWMAPEMVQATLMKDVGYDLAVDIWSLGCTIIEMFDGKPPWSDLEGVIT